MENKQTTIEEVQPVAEVTAVEQKVEEIKFPTIQNNQTDLSTFGNKEGFEHSMRVAKALSVSDLVPQQYKGNVSNCLIAMDISKRIGASELMVMQNLYIVHGKPVWSSQFLIATLNACKKFSPLRYEEDDKNGGRC